MFITKPERVIKSTKIQISDDVFDSYTQVVIKGKEIGGVQHDFIGRAINLSSEDGCLVYIKNVRVSDLLPSRQVT